MKNFNEKIIWENSFPNALKLLRVMKLTVFLILITVFCVFAGESYSQTKKLTLKMDNARVEDVLATIEKQSEFYFFIYSEKVIDVERKVSIDIKNENIETVLSTIFEGTNVAYSIDDRLIILSTPELISNKAQAIWQQATVSGKVTDAGGQPLPGVTIVVKGTTRGTVTNADGEYILTDMSPDATLVFSFVGMRTQEIVVGNQTTINVTMEEDVIGIEEVVAIGYGTLQRNRISTSIASLEPQKVTVQATSSIDRSLEGQIAGLSIKQNTGAPGGGAIMEIRGSGSIGAGDQPLVVIDGVPMLNPYSKFHSPLSLINKEDIKSIDVLKDASATAIYGSRGSNGVIIIETKSAEEGRTQFSFSAEGGLSQMMPMEKLDLMNAQEYAQWRKESEFEAGEYYGYEVTLDDIPEEYRYPEKLGEGTDWQDILTRVAPQQNYNLSVSHGTDDFTGYFSMSYRNEQGIVVETGYERLQFRANMDYDPVDLVSVGMNMNTSYGIWDKVSGTSTGNRGTYYGRGALCVPVDGPYKDDGPWENEKYYDEEWDLVITAGGQAFNQPNPLYALKNTTDLNSRLNIYFQPYLELNPLENLTFKTQYNLNLANNTYEFFKPSTISSGFSVPPSETDGQFNTGKSLNWQFVNTLNYEETFGNHRVSALAGYSRERYNSFSSSLNGNKFPDNKIETINASTEQTGSTSESHWSIISYMFRLNYDYKSKYLFTGTIRRDGCSRFGSKQRWGYFPSASVGWNVTKESFFPEADWLSNLKFRASYGMSGNNSIGNYTYQSLIGNNDYTFGGNLVVGRMLTDMENAYLTWEKVSEFNTGLDLTLLAGRLNFVFDFYNNITENMLWDVDIPISSGYSGTTLNLGKIRNRGLEFSINSINISKTDFRWVTDFNIAFNRNMVLDLGPVERILAGHRNYSITMVGQPIAMFYTWRKVIEEHGGVIPSPEKLDDYAKFPDQEIAGTPIFEDKNGDGIITEEDHMITGNPHPDFRGGMNNSLTYKNWDFNVSMSFAHNFDIFSQLLEDVLNVRGVFNNLKDTKNRWKSPDNPGTPMEGNDYGVISQSFDIRQIKYDHYNHSGWVHNVSFLKIQNVSMGYTFRNLNFGDRIRLYCTVQNLHTFTNYLFGNPDVNYHGSNSLVRNYDTHDYPLARTVIFGVNLNF